MRAAELLQGPGLPAEAAYLWEWFLELSAARPSGGFGPSAIAYSEILAWAQLTGRRPVPWEVRWIGHLDRVWMAAGEKAKPAAGGAGR